MSLSDLRSLAEEDNDNYIEGVYNYCNGWCERCPFTARCRNYAMRRKRFPDKKEMDLASEEFWQEMDNIFSQSIALLKEMAEEDGIDLEALDTPEFRAEMDARQTTLDDALESSPLCQATEAYMRMVDEWFEQGQEEFQSKGEQLLTLARLGIDEATLEANAISLSEAVEVIRWYQFFVVEKMMRAVTSAVTERDEDPQMLAEFGRDSDGTAKIALIAIDHSIGAWGVLLRAFPDREMETLTLLAHLDRLRRATEREFPNARAFVRAGWDTGELE